jgi:hypothetical protein
VDRRREVEARAAGGAEVGVESAKRRGAVGDDRAGA